MDIDHPRDEHLYVPPRTQHRTWCDFIDDEDPVLAAIALEMKNTSPRILACRRYYNRYVLISVIMFRFQTRCTGTMILWSRRLRIETNGTYPYATAPCWTSDSGPTAGMNGLQPCPLKNALSTLIANGKVRLVIDKITGSNWLRKHELVARRRGLDPMPLILYGY